MKSLDSFGRQQSSGNMITESHPIHALASLNSVAITLEDENETPDDPLLPSNLEMLNENARGNSNQKNSVPSEGRSSAGDVFI